MRVFITGATGFIGRALILRLRRDGHELEAWVRSEERARNLVGAEVGLVPARGGAAALAEAVERSEAIVHLAGENIFRGRWNVRFRSTIEASRVGLTRDLVAAIGAARRRPGVLVSSSAVGYYGDRGDEVLDEASTPGDDYLARVCVAWEAAALGARAHGVRVALLRTGVVLGVGGGALARMLPPFRLGAGGRLGSGRQYFPWIHLHDLVEVIASALGDARFDGPINGTAPDLVTNRDFTRALGRALHRPAILPVPRWAMRAAFGAVAEALVASERVEPKRLLALGFTYRFPSLESALANLTRPPPITIERASATTPAPHPLPGSPHPERRRACYLLRAEQALRAPSDALFAFFSRAENLGLLTPASLRYELLGTIPRDMAPGITLDYRLRIAGIPLRWRTRIEHWADGALFIDSQERGPFRTWWHEHHFRRSEIGTVMEDRIHYTLPLGPLGRLGHRILVAPALRRLFAARDDAFRLRFGGTGR